MEVTTKPFFSVFPDLKVSDDVRSLFEDANIREITLKKKENTLKISFQCDHLISRVDTWRMERTIREQLFSKRFVKIRFQESYHLSEQYNLKYLMEHYMKSFLFELKGKGEVIFNVVRKGDYRIEDDVITFYFEDTFVNRNKAPEIKEFFEMILKERFSIDAKVGFDFSKTIDRSLKMESDYRLQQEIHTIVEHADIVEKEQKEEKKARKKATATKKEHIFKKKTKYSDDPTLLYGRNCDGELMEIKDIYDEIGEVVIHGQITFLETREIRNEKTIIIFHITDFTDTISCKVFVRNEQLPDILDGLKKGGFYRIKAVAMYDKFDHEISLGSVAGIKAIKDFREKRQDTSMEKRVELHLHTVMSDNDSVVQIKDIVNRAYEWGHPAVAITDHGVLQGFPIARHAYEDLKLKEDDPFKIIYGVEGYFVDDLGDLIIDSKGQSLMDSYVVFDIETTGFNSVNDRIIEIGAVRVVEGEIKETFSEFVNPERPIPYKITQLTTITDDMVKDAGTIEEILPQFLKFCEGSVLVAHNAGFDTGFIRENAKRLNLPYDHTVVDTLGLARCLMGHLGKFTLDNICKHLNIILETHHRAVDDATATGKIFVEFISMLKEKDITDLDQVNEFANDNVDLIKKGRMYHGIILVKNNTGRVNLNRLVSESHLNYFNRRPRMPKSLINKYRDGLIIGSACEAGELYQALLDERSDETIANIVSFYDYLEIQPICNNMFMLRNGDVQSEEELREFNRTIVRLGRELGKPVCATGDVHFQEPEDETYRHILLASKKFPDADAPLPIYFKTTTEMLEEFSYLGQDLAHQVVIDNPRRIADLVEEIELLPPGQLFPPRLENSQEDLNRLVWDKCHALYGDQPPQLVVDRLNVELGSILGKYDVVYMSAQKLVQRSLENGYLVGSRGSVGSSLVAYMSGITEVNSLPPHYRCPQCRHVEFVTDGSYGCGADMPDKCCPECGTKYVKDGFDIPFETFLGYGGGKVPDIDLNFSGEYQARAHRHAIEMFGQTQVFRAGTIGTLAEKTAFGFVRKYLDERGLTAGSAEVNRLTQGCVGVRRTTGQHPGGLVVVPDDMDVEDFTAVQHPADAEDADTITTHFEYHCMEDNLLKLDMLGHDDPTMIRMLEDLTGVNARTIPLDDPDTMSIFTSSKVLGFENDELLGPTGAVAIPEFNTRFTRGMLVDTQPKDFNTLVRLSGFSHGTDVWLGNARDLIVSGTASVLETVGCRDDIMLYLIHMGLDPKMSFKIMEAVRKGKVKKGGFQDGWEDAMRAHEVPDWYIDSLAKIGYLFPKAHAVAYVMMAFRIAWFKVHQPLAFYATFFTVRAKAFDAEYCCAGIDAVKRKIREIENNKDATAVEQSLMVTLEVCYEFYLRGFHFDTISIYDSQATAFKITENGLLPPFVSVRGLGETAALDTVEKRKGKTFISVEEFAACCSKLSKTHIEQLKALGAFAGMADTSQITFF